MAYPVYLLIPLYATAQMDAKLVPVSLLPENTAGRRMGDATGGMPRPESAARGRRLQRTACAIAPIYSTRSVVHPLFPAPPGFPS